MHYVEEDLAALIARGKTLGYLTYDEVSQWLPDQDVSPEKMDSLLQALEEQGISLVDQAPVDAFEQDVRKGPTPDELQLIEQEVGELLKVESAARPSDDPIRMYLSQMARFRC
ncbi:MAG: RNA polymerase sigma factor region1.1 domain-containing protein [Pirellulaceae bacterium]